MEENNEIKMLEQNGSAVKNAENDLRDVPEEQIEEKMTDAVDSVISADQLAQIRALYNRRPKQMVRKHAKVGRNDMCPCGSGKKFKNCCMKSGQFEGLREI